MFLVLSYLLSFTYWRTEVQILSGNTFEPHRSELWRWIHLSSGFDIGRKIFGKDLGGLGPKELK